MADFLPVEKTLRVRHLNNLVPPRLRNKMDALSYIEKRRLAKLSGRSTIHNMLRVAGITKTQLAQRLGLRKTTVYDWHDSTIPRWAVAYLELWIEYQRLRP